MEALYDKALEHNISVAPGIIFSGDKRFHHHIRLNCSYACDDKITQAIKTLGELVAELSNDKRESVWSLRPICYEISNLFYFLVPDLF